MAQCAVRRVHLPRAGRDEPKLRSLAGDAQLSGNPRGALASLDRQQVDDLRSLRNGPRRAAGAWEGRGLAPTPRRPSVGEIRRPRIGEVTRAVDVALPRRCGALVAGVIQ